MSKVIITTSADPNIQRASLKPIQTAIEAAEKATRTKLEQIIIPPVNFNSTDTARKVLEGISTTAPSEKVFVINAPNESALTAPIIKELSSLLKEGKELAEVYIGTADTQFEEGEPQPPGMMSAITQLTTQRLDALATRIYSNSLLIPDSAKGFVADLTKVRNMDESVIPEITEWLTTAIRTPIRQRTTA